MNGLSRLACILLTLLSLAGAPLHATIARAVPFQEKVDAADAIVLGKVVATESAWDPTGRWILTRSTFEVTKALKGTPAPRLTLVVPGGTVGGVRQETVGVPSFATGGEHVVFVRSTAAGPTVAFFEQGVFDVSRDTMGEALVVPAASEVTLLERRAGSRAAAAEPPASGETLGAFERRVATAIRAGEQRRLEMAAGAAVEPVPGSAAGRFVREHRIALVGVSLAILLALGVILYKRP